MTARIAGGPGAAGRLLIACPDACGIVAAVTSNHKTPAPIAAQARVGFHHCPITEAGKAGQEPQVPGILREARADCIERTRSIQVLSQGTPGAPATV